MADWKRLTKALILADGVIGDKDAEIIRHEFLADSVINKSEAEFLIDLRNSHQGGAEVPRVRLRGVQRRSSPMARSAPPRPRWLEKFLLADGKVDEIEKAFLKRLKSAARSTARSSIR